MQALLPVYREVARLLVGCDAVPREGQALETLARQIEGNQNNEKLFSTLHDRLVELRLQVNQLSTSIPESIPYPFEHGEGSISIRQHLVPRVPEEQELGALLDISGSVTSKLVQLYAQLLARLALAAEGVEQELGLEPLPELQEPE